MPKGVYERQPRDPDKPPRGRPKKSKVTQAMVEALIMTLNMPLAFVMPKYALSAVESDALTVAIADLAASNQWVSNFIMNLVTVNSMAELPMVVGAIAIDKMVAAQQLPEMTLVASQGILEVIASRKGKKNEQVEARRTRRTNRGDGERENDDSQGATEDTPIFTAPDNETRPYDVAIEMEPGLQGVPD